MLFDNLEYIDEHTAIVKNPIVCMGRDPSPNMTPDDLRAWFKSHQTEQGLATAFARASNKAWWVEDDVDDYDPGTPEYEKAVNISDSWFDVMEEFLERIYIILRSEGVSIPEQGQVAVQIPFMERNGYSYGCGWWVKKEEHGDCDDEKHG